MTNITLPPLPPTSMAWEAGFNADQLRAYATAAVLADREARGEPVAHMYPSDLEKFQTSETFATAFSVAVGNPDERSVPLYIAPQPVEQRKPLDKDRALDAPSAHQLISAFASGVEFAERAHGIGGKA